MDDRDYSQYAICDADIWVKLSLGDALKDYFESRNKMVIADVVEAEIMRWKSSEGKPAKDLIEYCNKNKVIVFNRDDIPVQNRELLDTQLKQQGFSPDSSLEKNKGEIVSALYARHLGIPRMLTDDKAFTEELAKDKSAGIEILNWEAVGQSVYPNDKLKQNLLFSKVKKEMKEMNRLKLKHEEYIANKKTAKPLELSESQKEQINKITTALKDYPVDFTKLKHNSNSKDLYCAGFQLAMISTHGEFFPFSAKGLGTDKLIYKILLNLNEELKRAKGITLKDNKNVEHKHAKSAIILHTPNHAIYSQDEVREGFTKGLDMVKASLDYNKGRV